MSRRRGGVQWRREDGRQGARVFPGDPRHQDKERRSLRHWAWVGKRCRKGHTKRVLGGRIGHRRSVPFGWKGTCTAAGSKWAKKELTESWRKILERKENEQRWIRKSRKGYFPKA
jgi:hypothetical protein